MNGEHQRASSGTDRYQPIEPLTDGRVTDRPEPHIDDDAITNEHRSGLPSHTVEVPYAVIEAPHEVVGEQSVSHFSSSVHL